MENDHGDKIYPDGKRGDLGYDGTVKPVKLADIKDVDGDAVVVGALQADGHIITAEAMGLLVVEHTDDPE